MLPFPVFSSPSLSASSCNSHVRSHSLDAQLLPIFSTASKHATSSNSCNFIRFIRLLHTSLDTPGVGSYGLRISTHVTKSNVFHTAGRKVGYNLPAVKTHRNCQGRNWHRWN